MSEGTLAFDALVESNNILQEEITRLRYSNRTLRTVVRALRSTCDSLRAQAEQANFNDETFKKMCAEFVPPQESVPVDSVEYVGLADATGTVEPLSADEGKAL